MYGTYCGTAISGRCKESRRQRSSQRAHGSRRASWGSAPESATLPAPCRLDRGYVDLSHAHHRIERGLCFVAAGSQHLGQHARRDLPGDAPLVFAPTALALLAAITDDGVPVAVGLLLIVGGDLEREGFVVLERGTAVEADTGDARDRELDRQHVALPARWVVAGCTVNGTYRAIGKVSA